jgi:hypothetical protein
MIEASGLPISETLKYIGKRSKAPKVSDQQKSQERLERLEQSDEK